MHTPSEKIESPCYNKQEFEKRTLALAEENGPWPRYRAALEKLIYLAEVNTYPVPGYRGTAELPKVLSKNWYLERPDYPLNNHLVPYRKDYVPIHGHNDDHLAVDFDPEPLMPLQGVRLVSHAKDMLFNGFGMNIQHDIMIPQTLNKVVDCEDFAKGLLERFEKPYLDEVLRDRYKAMSVRNEVIPLKGPFYHDATLNHQQLQFLPREIERWIHANAQAIPTSDQMLFLQQQQEYSHAYDEILAYVSYAKGYINHIDGKSKKMDVPAK